MDSLQDLLKSRNIIISLRNFGSQDLGTGWEVKSIVENPDVFDDLYSRYPLTGLSSLEDYFLYLLSIKLVGLREVIPVLLQDAHKDIISKLSYDAEKVLSVVGNGDVIKFINGNIQDIFAMPYSITSQLAEILTTVFALVFTILFGFAAVIVEKRDSDNAKKRQVFSETFVSIITSTSLSLLAAFVSILLTSITTDLYVSILSVVLFAVSFHIIMLLLMITKRTFVIYCEGEKDS